MKILEFIKETIGKSLAEVLIKLFDAVKSVSILIMAWHKSKENKEKHKEKKQKEDKIDNVTNSGTLDDLLDI